MRSLDQGNDDCYCDCGTHCKYIKEIRLELFNNGFQTFDQSVTCSRIQEMRGRLTVKPEVDDNTDD